MNSKKFEEWRDAARRKAEELDAQFNLREKVNQGVDAANEAARRAGDAINEAAAAARDTAGRIDEQFKVSENLRQTAQQAGDAVREGARAAQEGAAEFSQNAETTAREVFGSASGYYRRAEQAFNAGAGGVRLTEAVFTGYDKARVWIRENPGKAAVVSLSLIAGVRAGSALPGLGATILGAGASGHWFFHSALPVVGIRKLTEKYVDYLKSQEERIARGELDEAERERLEFQRNMTKYVGAPLLGAFSIAAGAALVASAFSGATVTGFPVSLLLGANPLLNGVWFFANGVVCISEGYKFFMIALADQEEVARVVREIKGLLPAAETV
ncbi:MAG: hypothetical protein KF868_17040 [Acidobacteria bacterium]|nr:hypothetical protein [Acidobacteriota bacterium]MCW5968632.1 hypothetical protein [Blastocatellales bacterium]